MHQVRPVGPCLSLYHDEEYKEQDWDIEVCEPLAESPLLSNRVSVQELPAIDNMACTIHEGPFVTLHETYDAIMHWVDENGYQIIGPVREVYLKASGDGSQMDPGTVTEIQIPVKKI